MHKTLNSFSKILRPNGKLLLILQEGLGEAMIEEPFRKGVYIYTNYFSVKQISDLLLKHGFEIDNILREESPNDLKLGKGKLIVLSHNTKH